MLYGNCQSILRKYEIGRRFNGYYGSKVVHENRPDSTGIHGFVLVVVTLIPEILGYQK